MQAVHPYYPGAGVEGVAHVASFRDASKPVSRLGAKPYVYHKLEDFWTAEVSLCEGRGHGGESARIYCRSGEGDEV